MATNPSSKKRHMDFSVLKRYGIPFLACEVAKTPAQASAAAKKIGYPVALKLISDKVLHKSEKKAISLNIKNEGELIAEYSRLSKIVPASDSEGILVQKFMSSNIELIVGGKNDPQFGPTILLGLGGIYTEILKDTSLRVCPIGEEEASEMIHSLKSYPILSGARAQKPIDESRLVALLVGVSKLLMKERPSELDLNPIIISGSGIYAADMRILY